MRLSGLPVRDLWYTQKNIMCRSRKIPLYKRNSKFFTELVGVEIAFVGGKANTQKRNLFLENFHDIVFHSQVQNDFNKVG